MRAVRRGRSAALAHHEPNELVDATSNSLAESEGLPRWNAEGSHWLESRKFSPADHACRHRKLLFMSKPTHELVKCEKQGSSATNGSQLCRSGPRPAGRVGCLRALTSASGSLAEYRRTKYRSGIWVHASRRWGRCARRRRPREVGSGSRVTPPLLVIVDHMQGPADAQVSLILPTAPTNLRRRGKKLDRSPW